MEASLIIKILVFIILALFASWPYFEKVIEYSWLKRTWIGVSIICLLVFGIMDIINSETQAKIDKIENTKATDTIAKLSSRISKLDETISDIKSKESNRFDDMSDKLNALNDMVTQSIQENKGNIARNIRDTAKD